MFQVKQHGPVTVFKMGRQVGNFTLYPVHTFLLDETLIDSGTIHVDREFFAEMGKRRITTLINTHHHEDHIGNNRRLQDRVGVEILAHPKALFYLKHPEALKLHLYQRWVWGWPEPSVGKPIGPLVDTGRFTLEVIPSPGHCADHICLYEAAQGWLFTGDLFCGRGFKYLRADEDYPTILNSLRRLRSLAFDTIFCSLLGVVNHGKAALGRKIAVMEELEAQTRQLHEKGIPPRIIRKRLLGREGGMRWVTGGHYAKQNTVDSILNSML